MDAYHVGSVFLGKGNRWSGQLQEAGLLDKGAACILRIGACGMAKDSFITGL
jgi:hypothetical protein